MKTPKAMIIDWVMTESNKPKNKQAKLGTLGVALVLEAFRTPDK